MSINSVDLKKDYDLPVNVRGELPFDLMEFETIRYMSKTARQSFELRLTRGEHGRSVNIHAKDGCVYLTNKRIIFITASSGDVTSFSLYLSVLPKIQFIHKVVAPWFGANYWEILFHTNPSVRTAIDGLPMDTYFTGSFVFRDGGAFEFCKIFDELLHDIKNNTDIDESLPKYTP